LSDQEIPVGKVRFGGRERKKKFWRSSLREVKCN
jgi:hypothetical protein